MKSSIITNKSVIFICSAIVVIIIIAGILFFQRLIFNPGINQIASSSSPTNPASISPQVSDNISALAPAVSPQQNTNNQVDTQQKVTPLNGIDIKGITWVTPPKYDYDNMILLRNVDIDLWIVSKNGKYGIIRTDNTIVQPLKYDKIRECQLGHIEASIASPIEYHFLDRNGKIMNDNDCAHGFIEYYWDEDNHKPLMAGEGLMENLVLDRPEVVTAVKNIDIDNLDFDFVEPDENKRTYGIANGSSLIAPLEYDNIEEYFNGYFAAKKAGKSGYLGSDGKVAIPFVFEETRSFSKDGIAAVKINGLWGFIKKYA